MIWARTDPVGGKNQEGPDAGEGNNDVHPVYREAEEYSDNSASGMCLSNAVRVSKCVCKSLHKPDKHENTEEQHANDELKVADPIRGVCSRSPTGANDEDCGPCGQYKCD